LKDKMKIKQVSRMVENDFLKKEKFLEVVDFEQNKIKNYNLNSIFKQTL
jgi:hypothetical protein